MCEKKKLLAVGGDLRQLYCAARLSQNFDVYITGFEGDIPSFPKLTPADCSMVGFFDFAVLPINFFSKNILSTNELIKMMKPNGLIIGGKLPENSPDYRFFADYSEREDFKIANAVPSAEGAAEIALKELKSTINSQKVLIVGYGRIGKSLANILRGFGADITVLVHSFESECRAKADGLKVCREVSGGFSLIFNTAPHLIFDRCTLEKLNADTLIIDLASDLGGVDFECAESLGIKAIHALGLPAKTAPATAGEIVAETVLKIISERSYCNE